MRANIQLSKIWEMQIEYIADSNEHEVCIYINNRLKDAKIFDNILDAILFAYAFDFGRDAIDRNELNEKIKLYVDAVRLTQLTSE